MNAFRVWRAGLLVPQVVAVALICGGTLVFTARAAAGQATAPATSRVTTSAANDDDEEEREDSGDRPSARGAQATAAPNGADGRSVQGGFSVRKEDPKLIDAFEDFHRHSQKKAWELAFRSITSVIEKDPKGMVPAGDGLMLPTRQRVWAALAALPPDGREAYRLFNDAVAKQRFDAAIASGDDVKALRDVFNLYFITSVGDRAADRLGDACFEAGDFLAADSAWKAIIDHYPDTSLSKTRLRLKRCAALARAGRWDAFDEVAAAVAAAGASEGSETIRLAGRDLSPREYLASLRESGPAPERSISTGPASARAEPAGAIALPSEDKPLWQMRFADPTLSEKFEEALRNMGWGGAEASMGSAVPPTATDGKRIYLNWFGIAFAVDVQTGKLLWRSRKFSDLGNQAQQFAYGGLDVNRYHIALDGSRVLITGLPLGAAAQNFNPSGGTYRMVCHNTENGSVVWSTTTGDGASWNIASAPLPVGDTIYVAATRVNQQELYLLALTAEKGKLLWSVSLGTPQASVNYRGISRLPSPLLVQYGGALYVVTNNGAVVAVDPTARLVKWAFTCEPPPVTGGEYFDPSMVRLKAVKTPGTAFVHDSVLYFKEAGAYAMYALDLGGPSLKWRRTAEPADMLAGIRGGRAAGAASALLLGESASAIDLSSRAMRWSTGLPVETGMLRPLLAGDRLYVFSSRGVFELDAATGDPARPPFRGADLESLGGALWRCGDRLVSVSNLAVTAYPLSARAQRPESLPQ